MGRTQEAHERQDNCYTCYDDYIGEYKEAVAHQSLNPCVDKSDPFAEKVPCETFVPSDYIYNLENNFAISRAAVSAAGVISEQTRPNEARHKEQNADVKYPIQTTLTGHTQLVNLIPV